jgi:hypothetical protein
LKNTANAAGAGAATMYGPSIKQSDGKWRKTFLIAFIDDASRVMTHGEFFYNESLPREALWVQHRKYD